MAVALLLDAIKALAEKSPDWRAEELDRGSEDEELDQEMWERRRSLRALAGVSTHQRARRRCSW